MAQHNLDFRLSSNIDYTHRDEITFSLLDVIKCPIALETTDNMIIFNHQFYNRETFEQHCRNETSRVLDHTETRLKDPRTGQNLSAGYAMFQLLYSRPSRQILKNMIMK